MDRPLIGVTVDRNLTHPDRYESPVSYARAIELAGGLPVLLPYHSDVALIPRYLDRLDGILLAGGDDLDPSIYGQTWHPQAKSTDPARTAFEWALLAEIERQRVPTLGVCLGAQMMNVYRGGSLIQFLPDHARPNAIEHRKGDLDIRRHEVKIAAESLLAGVVGQSSLSVNTLHKQAIEKVGRDLRISATAPDGIVEGIEDPRYPLFLAVQWHPEKLTNEPQHLALFRLLVEKAALVGPSQKLKGPAIPL